jgi:hypothetical protein
MIGVITDSHIRSFVVVCPEPLGGCVANILNFQVYSAGELFSFENYGATIGTPRKTLLLLRPNSNFLFFAFRIYFPLLSGTQNVEITASPSKSRIYRNVQFPKN